MVQPGFWKWMLNPSHITVWKQDRNWNCPDIRIFSYFRVGLHLRNYCHHLGPSLGSHKCQIDERLYILYVFLQLSLLHCILFDHSSENKMLKHSVPPLVLVAGCKILRAFWNLNILVMSTGDHLPNSTWSYFSEETLFLHHLATSVPHIEMVP